MGDPNITMEEYIRLEEEKARRRGKVYNWETATYGKIWYDEDVHDLRSVETEFPAIVFDDAFTSEVTPSYESKEPSKDIDNVGGCAGDVVDFRTWPGISLETSMMSNMDLDEVTCLNEYDTLEQPAEPFLSFSTPI
ncbi:hypothetical protein Tco_1310545 [Tanacetum coccineum]